MMLFLSLAAVVEDSDFRSFLWAGACLKRAGLSRKVRNAGQRGAQLNEPSHTCLCSSFAVPSPHLFPACGLGGAVGGRAVRRGVCVCATATKDRSQGTIGFVSVSEYS